MAPGCLRGLLLGKVWGLVSGEMSRLRSLPGGLGGTYNPLVLVVLPQKG